MDDDNVPQTITTANNEPVTYKNLEYIVVDIGKKNNLNEKHGIAFNLICNKFLNRLLSHKFAREA